MLKWRAENRERMKEKALEYYHRDKELARLRHKRYYECNKDTCLRKSAVYKASNKEMIDRVARASYLSKYGLTVGVYEAMLKNQNGVCAICGRPQSSGKRLSVDHDHKTGVVRDLLCDRCNRGIGFFEDNPDLMLKAIEYIRKHTRGI